MEAPPSPSSIAAHRDLTDTVPRTRRPDDPVGPRWWAVIRGFGDATTPGHSGPNGLSGLLPVQAGPVVSGGGRRPAGLRPAPPHHPVGRGFHPAP